MSRGLQHEKHRVLLRRIGRARHRRRLKERDVRGGNARPTRGPDGRRVRRDSGRPRPTRREQTRRHLGLLRLDLGNGGHRLLLGPRRSEASRKARECGRETQRRRGRVHGQFALRRALRNRRRRRRQGLEEDGDEEGRNVIRLIRYFTSFYNISNRFID